MDIVGGAGLVLLTVAFLASVSGRLATSAPVYLLLNGLGAGILTWYSLRLGIWVFVILEGVWSLVAWWSLLRGFALETRKDASQ